MLDNRFQTALPETPRPVQSAIRPRHGYRCLPLCPTMIPRPRCAADSQHRGRCPCASRHDLHAIKYLAKEPTPRALMVDISGVPNPVDELDNLAAVCTPDVRVLVVGEDNRCRLLS